MALTFRYKNLASLSYAPGTAKAGENGDIGKQGTSGNTLYFIDYDLDNSYAIQLALQRIENNQILSSTRDKTINDRPYKENDIIISSSGKTYRIINSKESSAKNYKFDIEVLGAIHNQPSVNISKIIIANITSYDDITSVNDIDNSKCAYVQKSAATTNNANSLIGEAYTPEDFIMAGTWIKVYVIVTLSTISNPDLTETEQLESQYIDLLKMQDKTSGNSYSLTLYLNNKKSFQGMTPPCDYEADPVPIGLNGIFSFYKKLEFPNLSIFKGSTFADCLADEIKAKGLDDNGNLIYYPDVKPLSNIYFLSDIEMDGMHPSGNEIRCTLSASSDPIWYKTGKGTDYPNGVLSLGRGAFVFPYTDNIDEITSFSSEGYTKCELTNMKYHYNMVFNSTSNHSITSNDFPNYAVGESLTGLSSIKDEDGYSLWTHTAG